MYPSVHCSTIYNSQDMEATQMSIDRWMDKEVVEHIYSGILLSHDKQMWVSSSEVDEPRSCYTERSKSEREKQISYINTYIGNLGRWHWWTYLQGSNRDADIETRLVDTAWEGEGGPGWESSVETHTLPCVKQTASGKLLWNTGTSAQCSMRPRGIGFGVCEGSLRWRGYMFTYSWFCGVGEDSWESLALQGDPTSSFWRRSALGFLWKEWC